MGLTFDADGDPDGFGTGETDLQAVIDDVAFLARAAHRVVALDALSDRPRTRADLRDLTGVSSSTVGRTLRAFEARRWIDRRGPTYEATPLGSFVASGMNALVDRVATERRLREAWPGLPTDVSGFTVEMCADAVVSVAATADPYRPVRRFCALLGETGRFRFVGADLGLFEPCRDELRRRILDGVRTTVIDSPTAARHVLDSYPDHCAGPLASGNLTVRVHDDVPRYGLCLFDDRTAVAGYDTDAGTVRVLVDTDEPAAREWAEATYDRYLRASRPLATGAVA